MTADDVKEIIKWDIEVLSRKYQDRFEKIESNGKRNKQLHLDNVEKLREETNSNIERLKQQFEDYGNSIFDRITSDLTNQVNQQLESLQRNITESLREDCN